MLACEDRTQSLAHQIRRSGLDPSSLGYGRFVQADPIGVADGLNLYRYVSNDPVNSSDPSGLAEQTRFCPAGYSQTRYDSTSDIVYCQGSFGGGSGSGDGNTQQDCSFRGTGGLPVCPKESPQIEEGDIVVSAKGCGITCRRDAEFARNRLDKWVLMDGRFAANPFYKRPWYDVGLEGAIIIPPLIGAGAATIASSELLFAGGRLGLLNSNPYIRIGWGPGANATRQNFYQQFRVVIGNKNSWLYRHFDIPGLTK